MNTTCDKESYPTHQDALIAIKAINKRKKSSLHSYKCRACNQYHLASNGKKNHIPKLYNSNTQLKQPTTKNQMKKQPTQPLATQRLLSKEMVIKLKQLINTR